MLSLHDALPISAKGSSDEVLDRYRLHARRGARVFRFAGRRGVQCRDDGADPGTDARAYAQDGPGRDRQILDAVGCRGVGAVPEDVLRRVSRRSDEHTSELQSLLRTSYAD